MIFSYSALNAYDSCPYKFKLQSIDKIETEIPEAMQEGTEFHKFAENYFIELYMKNKSPKDDILKIMKYCNIPITKEKIINHWKNSLKNIENEYEKDFYVFEGIRLNKIMKNENVQHYMPMFLEHRFVNKIEGYSFKGFIDRIDFSKDIIRIIDYKGTKPKSLTRLRKQLNIYYLLFKQEYPEYNDMKFYIGSYFYKTGEYWEEEISKRSLNSTKKWVQKTCELILNDNTYQKKISPYTCGNTPKYSCQFKSICRGGK